MRHARAVLALLVIAALGACGRDASAPAPPPALPADLSAPPQETLAIEAPVDRLIDCAGAAGALTASDARAAGYAAVLGAALAKENLEAASLKTRLDAARARWAGEPAGAQSARVLVCQAEWPSPQP